MNVLVACEESQRVCIAFRQKGHRAFSCDIQPCSGGHPEWHIQNNVLPLLNGNCTFEDSAGGVHDIIGKWDLIIAHPPCTYLTVTGNRWFDTGKYGKAAWDRMKKRHEAICFFYKFVLADCDKVVIENPVGIMSTAYRPADQTIQPYLFGDAAEKKTQLWLKGVPQLMPTNIVEPPPRVKYESGKTMPQWYADAWKLNPTERAKERSKTFIGIAEAMAEQWG